MDDGHSNTAATLFRFASQHLFNSLLSLLLVASHGAIRATSHFSMLAREKHSILQILNSIDFSNY